MRSARRSAQRIVSDRRRQAHRDGARSRSASPRTCAPKRASVEVMVGDPEVADVDSAHRPLALDPRQEDRHHAGLGLRRRQEAGRRVRHRGVVRHLAACSRARRAFPHAQLRVSSVNGRIMLSGTAPDAATVDKAVTIAKQFGARRHQFGAGAARRSRSMLEVRFIEANRTAGRELGVQWNAFGKQTLPISARTPSDRLPVTARDQSDSRSDAKTRPVSRRPNILGPAADLADRRCRRAVAARRRSASWSARMLGGGARDRRR